MTADALNIQRSVAKAVIEQHGDYMLAVKDNYQELSEHIEEAINGGLDEMQSYSSEVEYAHGCIARHTVRALPFVLLKKSGVSQSAKVLSPDFRILHEKTYSK